MTRHSTTAEIKKIYAATGWDAGSQPYTGKTKPVEWVRIHNMPDFVYFNHAQHVSWRAGESNHHTKKNLKKSMLFVKLVTVKLKK